MTNWLTDAELDFLRNELLDLLPDTCRIERPTSTTTKGKTSEAWGTAVATANCRIDPIRGQRRGSEFVADIETGQSAWQLTLEWDTDIQDGDRVVFSSDTYEVRQIHDDHSSRLSRRVILVKVGIDGSL